MSFKCPKRAQLSALLQVFDEAPDEEPEKPVEEGPKDAEPRFVGTMRMGAMQRFYTVQSGLE